MGGGIVDEEASGVLIACAREIADMGARALDDLITVESISALVSRANGAILDRESRPPADRRGREEESAIASEIRFFSGARPKRTWKIVGEQQARCQAP